MLQTIVLWDALMPNLHQWNSLLKWMYQTLTLTSTNQKWQHDSCTTTESRQNVKFHGFYK